MFKRWIVICKVYADMEVYINVRAINEHRAKIKAVNYCRRKGYFCVEVIGCEQATKNDIKINEIFN